VHAQIAMQSKGIIFFREEGGYFQNLWISLQTRDLAPHPPVTEIMEEIILLMQLT
jgi:hypothetical protein